VLVQTDVVGTGCLERTASVVHVQVRSAVTGLPLYHAIVRLYGKTDARVLTTRNGTAIFQDAPSGVYRVRVAKTDMREAVSAPFHLECRSAITVAARLAPELLSNRR
ncbi:MAG TPA: hypothetical protein VIO32_02525, partial [Candidatus Baltobacteraceae bacterium]